MPGFELIDRKELNAINKIFKKKIYSIMEKSG